MDVHTPQQRSFNMSRICSRDTKPELIVRSLLHRMGYRFRLHRSDLPGSPDITLPRYNTIIFVHGCFWHRHKGCKYSTMPVTNNEKWKKKFKENVTRDKKNQQKAIRLGWNVLIIWECEIRAPEVLKQRLNTCLKRSSDK